MPPGHLSRNVLSAHPEGHQEDAAWDLIAAVRTLFPDCVKELERLGDDIAALDDWEDLPLRAAEWDRTETGLR